MFKGCIIKILCLKIAPGHTRDSLVVCVLLGNKNTMNNSVHLITLGVCTLYTHWAMLSQPI